MEAVLTAIDRLGLRNQVERLVRVAAPPARIMAEGERARFPLSPVADGYVFAVLLSVPDDRFYLHRQGGFAYVSEWYEGRYRETLDEARMWPADEV